MFRDTGLSLQSKARRSGRHLTSPAHLAAYATLKHHLGDALTTMFYTFHRCITISWTWPSKGSLLGFLRCILSIRSSETISLMMVYASHKLLMYPLKISHRKLFLAFSSQYPNLQELLLAFRDNHCKLSFTQKNRMCCTLWI